MIKKLSAFIISFFILFVFSSGLALADNHNRTTDEPTRRTQDIGFSIPNPLKAEYGSSIPALLKGIVDNVLLPIGGVIAVLAFIYSGFLYVTAQGNTTKIETAHRALLYTAIGTAILLGAWVITSVIENTINQLRSG